MKTKVILVFLCIFFLQACNGLSQNLLNPEKGVMNGEDDLTEGLTLAQSAQLALTNFFDLLNQGSYDQAVALYGGLYDTLQSYNPSIDPEDKAGLLEAGCRFNGLMCLKVLSATLLHRGDLQNFEFEVAFTNPDGSQFVMGPCCGETVENMPPQSTFFVQVTCENKNSCQVLDLPPYVP